MRFGLAFSVPAYSADPRITTTKPDGGSNTNRELILARNCNVNIVNRNGKSIYS